MYLFYVLIQYLSYIRYLSFIGRVRPTQRAGYIVLKQTYTITMCNNVIICYPYKWGLHFPDPFLIIGPLAKGSENKSVCSFSHNNINYNVIHEVGINYNYNSCACSLLTIFTAMCSVSSGSVSMHCEMEQQQFHIIWQ